MSKINQLAVRAYYKRINLFQRLRDDRGDAVVTWVVVIAICAVIAVAVYLSVGTSGGGIGEAIKDLGNRAASGLDSITLP